MVSWEVAVLRADELDLTNPSMPDGFLDHYNDLRKQLIQKINKYNEQYPRDVAMFGKKCSEFFGAGRIRNLLGNQCLVAVFMSSQ